MGTATRSKGIVLSVVRYESDSQDSAGIIEKSVAKGTAPGNEAVLRTVESLVPETPEHKIA
jgi:hypothetical protein